MGLRKHNSLSSLLRKPFRRQKQKQAEPESVAVNGSCGPVQTCVRCPGLEGQVAELTGQVSALRTEVTALHASVAALEARLMRLSGTARLRRDSYESCWDANSLRFYSTAEEGPHSTIGEDEFFDAVESALDRITEDQEFKDKMRKKQHSKPSEAPQESHHQLLSEVSRVSQEQLRYALAGVADGVWTLFAEEGQMKMYKREEEVDGLAVDPLKAVHVVSGVTAHEVCWHFWSPDVRLEWETTVEQVTILENIDARTAINLQVHKRVWPAAQRDSLFWSHIDRQTVDGQHWWFVVNNSTEYPCEAARESSDKYVRVLLTVCMACTTEIVGDASDLSKVSRDQLRCKITYCSVVNPGGWAPTSALRMVYKREYPRFLKRFTGYVIDQCKNRPIQW